MTFVSDAPGPAPILWITGLSGVGKTTLARAVGAGLRGQRTSVNRLKQCPSRLLSHLIL